MATILTSLVCVIAVSVSGCKPAGTQFTVPKTWEDAVMRTLEIPLAESSASPVHVTADYYYSIPVRPILKTYPVYRPDKEPPGYIEWLRRQKPELVFDPSKLKDDQAWIDAGEIVFDAPITTGRLGSLETGAHNLYVRDPKWFEATGTPVASDGSLPFYRYVINKAGKIEIGLLACAMCHTRIMPDGSIVK